MRHRDSIRSVNKPTVCTSSDFKQIKGYHLAAAEDLNVFIALIKFCQNIMDIGYIIPIFSQFNNCIDKN